MKIVIDNLRKIKQTFISSFQYIFLYYLMRLPLRSIRQFVLRHFFKMQIGEYSMIFLGGFILNPCNITIGSGTTIGHNCYLDGRVRLTIGNNVNICSEVMIGTMQHDVQSSTFGIKTGAVTIEDYAWVSTRSIILPGVRIGKGGGVAGGAVVTKPGEPYARVAGSPGKARGKRNENLEYILGSKNWNMYFI
ncbi:hypothetical protein A0J48_018980 [Sphaerospermopsis aphanizomenoides BCCUSP55]|uniref:acyltransferase n=1 Tax=Sphaerospermopsis aphanizomenoides TaxID=459663 RepID=UPI001902F2D2|nr:hypothetical protein [Sphaerospermopsis aphanizomenoides]MBK1989593.1 hypothetical protein [Sphaerospermopsis aphanizomenoides BCCUSP55]